MTTEGMKIEPITEVVRSEEINSKLEALGGSSVFENIDNLDSETMSGLIDIVSDIMEEDSNNEEVMESISEMNIEETNTIPTRAKFTEEEEEEFQKLYSEFKTSEQFKKVDEDNKIFEEAVELAAKPHEDDFDKTGTGYLEYMPETGINVLHTVSEPDTDDTDWLDNLEFGDIKGSDIAPVEDYELDPATEEERINKAYDNFLEETKASYDISDDNVMRDLLDIVVRAKNGEKFDYYDALPELFKKEIDKSIIQGGQTPNAETRKVAASFIIDGMVSDVNLQKELVDVQTAIEKEFEDMPDMPELWATSFKDQMEQVLPEMADKVRDTDPEKAAKIDAVVQSFKDSYTYQRIIDGVHNVPKIRNRITKDLDRYSRFVSDLNFRLAKSDFNFKDVNLMGVTLMKVLPDTYTDADIAKFIIAFVKTCDTLSLDRIEDVTYMYYTINNITRLAFAEESTGSFSKQIIKGVEDAIDEILSVEKERLANKPDIPQKKKKGKKRG